MSFIPSPPANCPPCQKAKAELRQSMDRSFGRARFMPDGSLVYPKRGFEPPPPIEGYTRDPGNYWRFIPEWPKCTERIRTLQMKPCGSYNVIMVCRADGCPYKQLPVKVANCQGCPFRKE